MDFSADAANGIAMEGYLYKRASNAFKTWSRYKFTHDMSRTEQLHCVFFFFFTPFLPPNISLRETQTSTVLGNSFDSVCGDFPLSVFPFFAD